MSQYQLYIPKKIRVGFQKREDCFTAALGYVIYLDMRNVWRKETSWSQWRDKKIDPVEHDNVPLDGFVLNKKVGGYRSNWNYRSAHIRIYDPRDFEFEISVENLLFILTQCDCSRGKGLEGKFVYAWDGTELVLLPERSEQFQKSQQYTVLQAQRVKAKELVPGTCYLTKKQEPLTFVGRFDYYHPGWRGWGEKEAGLSKRYIFWDGNNFVPLKNTEKIAATTDAQAMDLAELTQLFYKSSHGSPIKELFLKDTPRCRRDKKGWCTGSWFYQDGNHYIQCDGRYKHYESSRGDAIESISERYKVWLEDGCLEVENVGAECFKSGHRGWSGRSPCKWREPTWQELWAKLESGAKYRVYAASLLENKNGDEDD